MHSRRLPTLRKRWIKLDRYIWGYARGAFGARAICFGWHGFIF